ncbi:MAG: hypothetical protein ACTSXD_05115 [Candidatus Heimdallarchaeaceae archaeon]
MRTMDRKRLEKYLYKKVKVLLKNRFKFSGKILGINEDSITIDDWKDGITEIDIASIGSVSEDGRK